MLTSIGLILMVGLILGRLCERVDLPPLLGMLLGGIIIGPYGLDIIDQTILGISSELRTIALIIILTRAGLSLDISDLRKIGRPAFFMSFLPASFELMATLFLGPILLGLSLLDSAIMGSVLAAVSPAVVVPAMIKLIDQKYGTDQGVPQLILAGASIDDVYAIVLFNSFINISLGEDISFIKLINIPFSIGMGILIGFILAYIAIGAFKRFNISNMFQPIIILSLSFLLVEMEEALRTNLTFSALIAIMTIGMAIQRFNPEDCNFISEKYNELWTGGQIFLFVLIGASVNINYLTKVGPRAILLIVGILAFRMVGVLLSLIGTDLNYKERIFTIIAYTPKATVQAAIGGIPLSLGLSSGETILTVAVLAIVITAPLGAIGIRKTYKSLLLKAD